MTVYRYCVEWRPLSPPTAAWQRHGAPQDELPAAEALRDTLLASPAAAGGIRTRIRIEEVTETEG